MIDLYTWPTPNGLKLHITLEELGIPYIPHPVNIRKGEQFDPEFLKISPNNKIPAMIDQEGPDGKPYSMFESAAMMMYLAEKTGQLLPSSTTGRYRVIQWLMFQMGHIGPMFGQYNHFNHYAQEKIQYAIDRYTNECLRLYGVLDKCLEENQYLTGDEYNIADIANYSWTYSYERRGFDLSGYDHVLRWLDTIGARPAVQRGIAILDEHRTTTPPDKETLENYFGKTQYVKR